MDEIMKKLQVIFRDVFDDNAIVLTEEIVADDIEGWDSLTHFQMIMEVEMKFNMKFTTYEIASLNTVGDLALIIMRYQELER